MSSSKSVCSRQSQRSTLSSRSSYSNKSSKRRSSKSSLFHLLQLAKTRQQSHDETSILSSSKRQHQQRDHHQNFEEIFNDSDEDSLSSEQKLNWFKKLDELDRCVSGIERQQTQTSHSERTSRQSHDASSSSWNALFHETAPEKRSHVQKHSLRTTRALSPSIQRENLMITNLSQLNQHEMKLGASDRTINNFGGKSQCSGSVKSGRSNKVLELEIAKTVLLQAMQQQEREVMGGRDRFGKSYHHKVDHDASSVVSSYTVHDILDDLTECEDLDSQSVWSFRSARSGRSMSTSRSSGKKKGGVGRQSRGRNASSTSVSSNTSTFQSHGWTSGSGSVMSDNNAWESYQGTRQQGGSCNSRTAGTRSKSLVTTLATTPAITTVKNPLVIPREAYKMDETEQLYRAFLKNLNKQERLAHDAKVLSNASNVRAAIEAQNFSQRFKAKVNGQTFQENQPVTKEQEGGSSQPLSQEWAVDIFENDQDWFSFNDFEMGQSSNAFSQRQSGISSHRAHVHTSGFDTSSLCTISSRISTANGKRNMVVQGHVKNQDLTREASSYSSDSDFKSTGILQSDPMGYGTSSLGSLSYEIDSQFGGAAISNPRYNFCDDSKVLKRMQKPSVFDSPTRINSRLDANQSSIKSTATSEELLAPVPSSNNIQVKSSQDPLQYSLIVKSSSEDSFGRMSPRPPGMKNTQKDDLDFLQSDNFDYEGKNDFKFSVVSSRGQTWKETTKDGYGTKEPSETNQSSKNSNNQMSDSSDLEGYDSGWEGFVISKKFESIPSGWDTEEESDGDGGEFNTPDTPHVKNTCNSTSAKISHKSEWSETSPTGVADLNSKTEIEWLKGSSIDRSRHLADSKNWRSAQKEKKTTSGSKKLFSDDLFQNSSNDDVQWL